LIIYLIGKGKYDILPICCYNGDYGEEKCTLMNMMNGQLHAKGDKKYALDHI
jgi:hypothetical protein